MKKILYTTFAHPHGPFGRLGGIIMARSTRSRNTWTISLLTLHESDYIIEVGSGPGVLIQSLTPKVPQGFVAGIDASPLMVSQATRRNAPAIQAGYVEIQQGTGLALPFDDALFDVALSANSVPFWPDRQAGVKEMWRVLKPGGTIALVLQPFWARAESEVKEIGAELVTLLQEVGFQQNKLEFKSMKPIASVCALGAK